MIFKEIKKDRMSYLGKDSVAFGILGLVISEIQRTNLSDDVPDEKVVKVIKKLIESIDDSINKAKQHSAPEEKIKALVKEHEVLTSYLPEEPVKLTEEELTVILSKLVQEEPEFKTNVGRLFGFMKSNYPNQYDGAVIKTIMAKL